MKSEAIHRRIRKFSNNDRLYFHRYKLSNEDYHKCTNAVSSSALKTLYHGKNPSLCYEKFIAKTIPFKQTEATKLGSAAHKFVLERRAFKKEFAVYEGRKSGKIWENFQIEHPNRTIITIDQYDECRRIKDAVDAHPEASMLLSGGEAERSVFWRDEETSLLCRARADYVKNTAGGSKLLIDLKTCISAEQERFTKQLCNLGYPIQSAFYREGFEAQGMAFIAVEKGQHITVQVYELSQAFDDIGYMQYREALDKWELYTRTNNWPGYFINSQVIEPPYWLEKEMLGN